MTVTVDLTLNDLLSPAVVADPYPTYALLRETDPVHWNPLFHAWIVTRYDDVLALHQDSRIRSGWGLSRPVSMQTPEDQAALDKLLRFRGMSITGKDGQDHRRMRMLVGKAFSPRLVEQTRGFIQGRVDALLDEAIARGHMEVMQDFALPLSTETIFHICGIPKQLHKRIIQSANHLAMTPGLGELAPGELAALTDDAFSVFDDVLALIDAQAADPQDNLIGHMLRAEESGHVLEREEMSQFVYTLLLGGFETTARMLTNGALALLRNPDQLALLRSNPALIDSAVNEVLRFDPSVMLTFRTSAEEILVRDKVLKPGEMIFLALGAANRDPEQFPDPDRFDITRQPNRHLSFGHGSHFCIGASLGRLEGQIALNSLVQRLPNMRLATTELEWNPNFVVRDIKALPIVF
ncbi:MAG TPA: cytochrome P450 [Roseiflexaceae bacterium]|nr:cytochrome P450 [Roseiflexaceae bacterium]